MSKTYMLFVLVTLLLAVPERGLAQQTDAFQAVVVKKVADVTRRAPDAEWEEVVPLDLLGSGYEVKTGEQSLALIRFPDETKLVVRELAIVEITGTVEGRRIRERNVQVDQGKLTFDVQKREGEEFRFSSPTAVASIRGTRGDFYNGPDSTTVLNILEGKGELRNLITGETVTVGAGTSGTATATGTTTAAMTQGQKDDVDDALEQGTRTETRRIRVQGRDAEGNPKIIIIEWQEPVDDQ